MKPTDLDEDHQLRDSQGISYLLIAVCRDLARIRSSTLSSLMMTLLMGRVRYASARLHLRYKMFLKRSRENSAYMVSEAGKTPERILAEKIEALSNADKSSVHSTGEAQSTRHSTRQPKTPKFRLTEERAPHATVIKRRASKSRPVTCVSSLRRLKSILQPKRKRDRRRPSMAEAPPENARPQSSHYATPFYAFHERENDDLKSKPYGGILSEQDAETTKTLPLQHDRKKVQRGAYSC